ncbi:translation initiation factor eIF2B subunit delta-like [Lineus longissimus]|uniref:translation initiation factor eIF2B subunit delta-like n=1 Tax=Lineus longissimus TaxID=88925 RepID=UPI00315D8E39
MADAAPSPVETPPQQKQGKKKQKGHKSPQGPKDKGQKGQGQKPAGGHGQKSTGGGGQGQKPPAGEGQKPAEGQSQKPESQVPKPTAGQGQKPVEVQGADAAPQKSKAELKAERRAKQEAQRAAKMAAKGGDQAKKGDQAQKKPEQMSQPSSSSSSTSQKKEMRVSSTVLADDAHEQKRVAKKLQKQQVPQRTKSQKTVSLFSHLHQYEKDSKLTQKIQFSSTGLHPAFLRLGVQYAEGIICGSNARCVGLLAALKRFVGDYTTPPQKELARDMEARLKPNITFLNQCRPLSVSMGNAIKYIKWHITHTPSEMSDSEAKKNLFENIDNFVKEKVVLSGKAILQSASAKIRDNDVIIVYGCSSLIYRVLSGSHEEGKRFRVIVVDGRPKNEGKEMLRRLVKLGVQCSYVLISAAAYVMKEATMVLLGAHALLANGCVMSRVGTSQIALVAKAYNVPVLVCCETYKFCERVQTDSFVFNELADPNDLVKTDKAKQYLSGWRDIPALNLLNLMYDVTPPELVTIVITELGKIPCTSVPVVLRVKQVETNE